MGNKRKLFFMNTLIDSSSKHNMGYLLICCYEVAFSGSYHSKLFRKILIEGRCLLEGRVYFDVCVKRAALINGRGLFEAWRLLEEIRLLYFFYYYNYAPFRL